MKKRKLLVILALGIVLAFPSIAQAQLAAIPETKHLEQAYNPLSTLEASTTTEVSNMLVLLKYGRIEVHEAVFCKLDVPFNSTRSYHGMLLGDMTLTLDSLPPDSEKQLNLFDAMNPGEDVVLHPRSLYFHVGVGKGFNVENPGYVRSYRQWGELPEELREQFYNNFISSIQSGWWDTEPEELVQRAGFEPISLLNTQFGGLGTPGENDWYIRLNDIDGELWEFDTEYEDLKIYRGSSHKLEYFGRPPSPPRSFLSPDEKNYRLWNFDYLVEIKAPDPEEIPAANYSQFETLTYDLKVIEPAEFVDLNTTLFRTVLKVTDGLGNPLDWDESSFLSGKSYLRVNGHFEPGNRYTIVVFRKTLAYFNSLFGGDIHKLVFTPSINGYLTTPPMTISVRMPEGEGYKFVAAAGADISDTASEFSASWPAGSLSHGVIAHKLTTGTFQADNYLIEYIVDPSLLDSPEVRNSIEGFAAWLDFTAELRGKSPVDKWVVVIDADSDSEDVGNPMDTDLKPVDTLFPRYRIWQFTNEILEIGQAWFFLEPEFWHDAVVDYRYFAALREFENLLEAPKAQKERDTKYYLHNFRHIPGTADELIDWRMERYLGFRISAALLAIDHEAPELLRESIIKHLFSRGMKEGKLSFEEISQTFLALEDTPASYWWQSIVLDGDLPVNEVANEDYQLPGITIPRLEANNLKKIYRKAHSGQLSGNPYGARYFYQRLNDEDVSPKMTYWKAENHYMFGEYEHALKLLDIADSAYVKPERAANRYVLRPLCLLELGREVEALAAIEHGLEVVEGIDYLEDFASALMQIKEQLTDR